MLHTHFGYGRSGNDVTVTHDHHCDGDVPGEHDHDETFLAIYHDVVGTTTPDGAMARRAGWLHRLQDIEAATRAARNTGDRLALVAVSDQVHKLATDVVSHSIPLADPLRQRLAACRRAVMEGLGDPI